MQEKQGDIWEQHKRGDLICVTTNGMVRNDGAAVMGRGSAKQAARRYPRLPAMLGQRILKQGNHTYYIEAHNLVTLPVKHNWWEIADPALIERSIKELVRMNLFRFSRSRLIYLVRPGCGNGQLNWELTVKPVIEPLLSDDFVIVEKGN